MNSVIPGPWREGVGPTLQCTQLSSAAADADIEDNARGEERERAGNHVERSARDSLTLQKNRK